MAKLIILRGNSGSGKTSAAKELQRKFGRGTLLLSGEYRENDPLENLMYDFFCTTPEGVKHMCEISEKIRKEGLVEGKAQMIQKAMEKTELSFGKHAICSLYRARNVLR